MAAGSKLKKNWKQKISGITLRCTELDRRRIQTVRLTLAIVAANFLLWTPLCLTSAIDALWPHAIGKNWKSLKIVGNLPQSCCYEQKRDEVSIFSFSLRLILDHAIPKWANLIKIRSSNFQTRPSQPTSCFSEIWIRVWTRGSGSTSTGLSSNERWAVRKGRSHSLRMLCTKIPCISIHSKCILAFQTTHDGNRNDDETCRISINEVFEFEEAKHINKFGIICYFSMPYLKYFDLKYLSLISVLIKPKSKFDLRRLPYHHAHISFLLACFLIQ